MGRLSEAILSAAQALPEASAALSAFVLPPPQGLTPREGPATPGI
ncbi:hypothetical protein [Pelomicrobium sp.]